VYALNNEVPTDKGLLAFFEPWRQWFDENVERVGCVEQVFVHSELGYAGRVDMVALLKGGSATGLGGYSDPYWAVVDFKTQKVKRSAKGEPKPAFYETWPLQLAAYRQAVLVSGAKHVTGMVSVVIDSAQPGPVHVKRWDDADYLFGSFVAALGLWKYVKGYDPVHPGLACDKPALN